MKTCGALLFVLFCVCVENHTVESSIQFQLHYDNQGTANKDTECENGGRKEVGGGADEHDETNQHDATEQQNIVNIHNQLRRGVQPTASNMLKMMWNEEAAANAQRWANKCILEHSPGVESTISTSGCGENLYMSSAESSWDSAIGAWYDEVKDWKYGEGSVNGGVVGHFTQVVWYRSNQIGCAMAHCPDANYKYFYVCQYCPAGNYGLERPYKSGPSCGDCPNDCEDKLCTNPCPYRDKWSNCADLGTWGCTTNNCQASCTCTTGQII